VRIVRSTRRRKVLILVVLLLVLFLLATARLFLWPPSNSPSPANAVVSLSGPWEHRASSAFALAHQGFSKIVVVSLGNNNRDLCPPAPPHIQVICFRPNPVDTRGEAEFVARLVARRHWRKIIIIPERSQTTRARLLFERCTNVSMEFVPVQDPSSRLPFDLLYEWGALMKALVLKPSC